MLNCMATCRSMDKKPYDNIMEEPTFSALNNPVSEVLAGGDTIESIIQQKVQAFEALGSSSATFAGTKPITRFLLDPVGLGKVLCPSVR